jgi:NAD(P)-dependent dehydrogenase (short-subunit alcohol dehydrogenase family)
VSNPLLSALNRADRNAVSLRSEVPATTGALSAKCFAIVPEEKAQQLGPDSPLGRPVQPAEPAPLFVFVASDESSYITGEVVGVTGGKPLAEGM